MSEHDWGVLEYEGVHRTIENVARSMARHVDENYGTKMATYDDVYQEAVIAVTTVGSRLHGEAVSLGESTVRWGSRPYAQFGEGIQYRLNNIFRTEMRRANNFALRTDPDEAVKDYEDDYYEPAIDLDGHGDYNHETVMAVLPALWDESYALRLDQSKYAADGDMPKGSGGMPQSNTHWALIADVRSAWERSGLTLKQKQALLLAYGMGETLEVSGRILGIAKPNVHKRIKAGLNTMCNYLNGTE